MAAKKAEGAAPALPPIMVGKFEDIAKLIEQLVLEQTSVFGENIQRYREERRKTSERPLTPAEAGQVAASWAEAMGIEEVGDAGEALASIQKSDLRASDDVPTQELLLAAGLATAPALIDSVKTLVALIEMPNDEHEAASEDGNLREALAERAKEFRKIELGEARARASAALAHFQVAAGAASGEALGLVREIAVQALSQALKDNPTSAFASLTGSLPSTDGPEE